MARIESIALHPFRIPIRGSLAWGKSSQLEELHHLLVEVTLADGSVGRAEIPPRSMIYGETLATIQAVISETAPRLIGLEASDTEVVLAQIYRDPYQFTARAGLEWAIFEANNPDLLAVFAAHDSALVSTILGMGSQAEVLAEAEAAWQAGIQTFKVKVGRNFEADLALIGALGQAFPLARLYADANQTFSADSAPNQLERLAAAGIIYVEEPLPVQQVKARARLRASQILPLIADDSVFTLPDLERELALDTFDILNLKPARTGPAAAQQMLALAHQAGKGVMIGSQASSSFGAYRAAVLSLAEPVTHPCELGFHLRAQASFFDFPAFRAGSIWRPDLAQARFLPENLAALVD